LRNNCDLLLKCNNFARRKRKKYSRELYFHFPRWFNQARAFGSIATRKRRRDDS
jgi:hypothetical protein